MRYLFTGQAVTFSKARRCLMLPHPKGEAESIREAFNECAVGLQGLPPDELNPTSREWVTKLEKLMGRTGSKDPGERVSSATRAEQFTVEQKRELSNVIDALAHWFHDQGSS